MENDLFMATHQKHSEIANSINTGWWVYIIQCKGGDIYTGISTDPSRRFDEHVKKHHEKKGPGAKFFLGHKPEKIIHKTFMKNRSDASKLEYQIKKMSKNEKLRWIATQPS